MYIQTEYYNFDDDVMECILQCSKFMECILKGSLSLSGR